MMKRKTAAALAAFTLAGVTVAAGQARTFSTEEVELRADVVADGLENPWGLAFLPDGSALVTERPGRMRLISPEGELSDPIDGVPDVWAKGQGGLLDVALAPDFASSGTIFFTFSDPGNGGAGTAIARARLMRDGGSAQLENVEVLFSMDRKTSRGQHFGSRIVMHPDGTIFFSTGDRGQGRRAQDLADSAGAVLRINADGSIPADNPYAQGQNGALPQIWSKGHRNPQGMAYDPVTESLWTVEHGAKGGDELNNPQAGKNYGWPVISYGVDYSGAKIGEGTEAPGFEQPAHYWDPSIAPSGLTVYSGPMFPEWEGDFLLGALKFQLLSRLDRDAGGAIVKEERMLEGEFGRIRDVNVAPDGSIWLLTDETDGAVVRLSRGE
jgi:aldose sugar dehydrogenase